MARSFNGSTYQLTNTSGAAVSGVPATFAAWYKPNALSSDAEICGCSNPGSTTQLFRLMVLGTDKVFAQFRSDSSAITSATGTTNLTVGVWCHVAATFDASGNVEVFHNGSSEATGSFAGSPSITLSCTDIGYLNRPSDINFANGDIAEVGMWSAVLSDNEISALARGSRVRHIRPGSLALDVPIEGLQSPEPDYSGNGIDMTVTGATYATHAPVSFATRQPRFPLVEAGAVPSTSYYSGMSLMGAGV